MFGPEDLSYLSIKELGMVEEYQEDFDKDFVKILKRFDNFSDVDRIDELINLLKSLRHNEHYIGLVRVFKKDYIEEEYLDSEKIPFLYAVGKGFGFSLPIILVPGFDVVNLYSFVGLESVVELSYAYSVGHKLTCEDNKKIVLGDILPQLTYFVEDYDKHYEIPKPNIEFFKNLKKIKIEKKAKKLNHIVYKKFVGNLYTEIHWMHGVDTPREFNTTFYNSSLYLAGCNAIKDSRDTITCDDLVVGYLLTFRVLLSDVRPLVEEYYSEDKWLEYNKKIKVD